MHNHRLIALYFDQARKMNPKDEPGIPMNEPRLVVLYIDFDQARRMNLPGGICLYCQDCHMHIPLGMAPRSTDLILVHQAHQKACEGPQ